MKICIVGQGYIGLPTAALFAKNGCEVLGVDVNEEIVDKLNQGKSEKTAKSAISRKQSVISRKQSAISRKQSEIQ